LTGQQLLLGAIAGEQVLRTIAEMAFPIGNGALTIVLERELTDLSVEKRPKSPDPLYIRVTIEGPQPVK